MEEFSRIRRLPPYVFAVVGDLKMQLRRQNIDIVDFSMGNPDIPTTAPIVEKLAEAAAKPVNHRYSLSRGIPNLRKAVCDRYKRQFNVDLDPDSEAAGARPVFGSEARGERVGILVDQEGAIALAVSTDRAGLVPRHLGEAHAPEIVMQVLRLARRRGEFDEFEAVDAHRVVERGRLHAKIGLSAHGGNPRLGAGIV